MEDVFENVDRTIQAETEEYMNCVDAITFSRTFTADPFSEHRPTFRIPKKNWVVLLSLPGLAWILLLICFGIDKIYQSPLGVNYTLAGLTLVVLSFIDLAVSCFLPGLNASRNVIEVVLGSMSVLFGLLITVIGIIVQLAAVKFTR